MPRVTAVSITNYRSIKRRLRVDVPERAPLVLVGENNAGKSNIVGAISLVLGEAWPGNYEPQDHEFFNRDADADPIEIVVETAGLEHTSRYGSEKVQAFVWEYPPDEERGKSFYMRTDASDFNPYVSNSTRQQCTCIAVSADRRLSYQLSYASKYTFLSRLMRQFHRALIADESRVDRLRGQLDSTRAIFQEVEAFSTFSGALASEVERLSGNLAYGLTIDFSAYDPSNFFHALRVFPHEAGEARSFDELGTGQEQILALAFAHAYARAFHGQGNTLVLVIEEPEAHLHPLAQEWVGRQMHELAALDEVQVILTTHSPSFVKIDNLPGLAVVRKGMEGTQLVQLSAEDLASRCRARGAANATAGSILPFYAAAATSEILAGFFARKVVLVEGPTESTALPVLLGRIGLDTTKEGIAVVSVQGVGNLAKWWRLFTAYGFPTYVIFDNDADADDDARRRNDLLGALGVEEEARGELLSASSLVVTDSYAVFGENYERTMRGLFSSYADLEQEAAEVIGLTREAKPLVARYAADRLDVDEDESGWQRMHELSDALERLSPEP